MQAALAAGICAEALSITSMHLSVSMPFLYFVFHLAANVLR